MSTSFFGYIGGFFRSDKPQSSVRLGVIIAILATLPIQYAISYYLIYTTKYWVSPVPISELITSVKGALSTMKDFTLTSENIALLIKTLPTPVVRTIDFLGVAAVETALATLYTGLLFGKGFNKGKETDAGEGYMNNPSNTPTQQNP
jgi:hypothetical protein